MVCFSEKVMFSVHVARTMTHENLSQKGRNEVREKKDFNKDEQMVQRQPGKKYRLVKMIKYNHYESF